MGINWTQYNGYNVNHHKGGGIMGDQTYLMANLGKYFTVDANVNSHRRWGKHVMKDLLCRDLPALRNDDVSSFIPNPMPTNTLSFRKGVSCNKCHATMDQLSGVTRNFIRTQSTADQEGDLVRFFITRPTDQPSASIYPVEGDTNYYKRPPEGRLLYRSYSGALIDRNIANISDLGLKLATDQNINDLYVCAAKKYYKYLTGVEVNLADPGDPLNSPLTPGETFHRNRVINFGLALKNHQRLKTLIQDIIQSSSFITPDQGQ